MKTARSGFALVELMVVLSIIAALTAIALPNLLNAGKRAAAAVCGANRLSIAQSEALYLNAKDRPSVAFTSLVTAKLLDAVPACPSKGTLLWGDTSTAAKPVRSLLCSIHLPTLPVSAQPGSLFSSTFADMNGIRVVMGGWTVSNGLLIPSKGAEPRAVFGDVAWKDYQLVANATLVSGSGYGIYYRADGMSNITGYAFQYDPGLGNKLVVRKVVAGKESGPIASYQLPAGYQIYNQSHQVSITVVGDQHLITVDGKTVLSFRDASFSTGSAGFRSWNNNVSQFGDVVVTRK